MHDAPTRAAKTLPPAHTREPADRQATQVWLALAVLTAVSVLAAGHALPPVGRLLATLAVAVLCAVKGQLLVQGDLRSRRAGPLIHRLVQLFAALAPVLLTVSALIEAAQALQPG